MPGAKIWGWYDDGTGTGVTWLPVKVDVHGRLEIYAWGIQEAIDDGSATGGTVTTLVDNLKNWEPNMWVGAFCEVKIFPDILDSDPAYLRNIVGNTLNTLQLNPANPLPLPVTWGSIYKIGRNFNQLVLPALAQGLIHNQAVVAAADILAAAVAPTNPPCLFRVAAGFDAAGVLSATITNGGNTQVQQLNHGVVLTANCLFMFDCLVHTGDTINYQYSVNATCQTLRLQEMDVGSQ